jgi:hypothetical protein
MFNLREEFNEILDNIINVDVDDAPNSILMKALAEADGIDYPKPILVACSMTLDVDQSFVDDTELLSKTVEVYVSVLNKIWIHIVYLKRSLDTPEQLQEKEDAFLRLVKGMSIKYNS